MKNLMKTILLLVLYILAINLPAQQDCMVLKPEISGKYEGKCRDGLAHGKGNAQGTDSYVGQFMKGLPHGMGTYIWANGDSYTGDWEKGMRQGEGTCKFTANGNDTILTGLWKNDAYLGPKPPRPSVLHSASVDRYSFNKTNGLKNRVMIDFYLNGSRNAEIEDLNIVASSGTLTSLGALKGFENIIFPVTVKVNYTTWNKLHTVRIYAMFEFEIFEPGDWVVDLHN